MLCSILIHPKATANVDIETDKHIQEALRKYFHGTILTVAHRLNTIIDYDLIVVLDKGSVVEIGTPKDLLDKNEGEFAALVAETGAENEKMLRGMAGMGS